MAFVLSDFKPGDTTGNAPAQHSYTTIDAAAVVQVSGYFNDIAGIVSVGDVIYVAGDTDGTLFCAFYAVVENDGTTVDVSDGTAISVTDSD